MTASFYIFTVLAGFILLPLLAVPVRAEVSLRDAVADLRSADPDLSRRARLELLRPENAANLAGYRDEVLKAITNVTSEQDAVLLGMLNLPAETKEMVLNAPETPNHVRARLGDTKARDRVIERFKSASSLVEVRKAAADILYANGAEALEAFAKRLESKEVFEDPFGNRVSAALLLIQAYGQAHPREPLFSKSSYLQHANVSPQEFRAEAHQSYLRKIEKHFKERHQLEIHMDPPLLLDTEKIEVYRQKISK